MTPRNKFSPPIFCVFIASFEQIQYVNLVFISAFEHGIACWVCGVCVSILIDGFWQYRPTNELNQTIVKVQLGSST